MKVLVCGGRDFGDVDQAHRVLDELHARHGFTLVIDGDARGADRIAGEWAVLRGIESRKFPADWQRHRRSAGPRRNQQMLDEGRPDLVVAFPGGAGTRHMVTIARAAGVTVIEVPKGRARA